MYICGSYNSMPNQERLTLVAKADKFGLCHDSKYRYGLIDVMILCINRAMVIDACCWSE